MRTTKKRTSPKHELITCLESTKQHSARCARILVNSRCLKANNWLINWEEVFLVAFISLYYYTSLLRRNYTILWSEPANVLGYQHSRSALWIIRLQGPLRYKSIHQALVRPVEGLNSFAFLKHGIYKVGARDEMISLDRRYSHANSMIVKYLQRKLKPLFE